MSFGKGAADKLRQRQGSHMVNVGLGAAKAVHSAAKPGGAQAGSGMSFSPKPAVSALKRNCAGAYKGMR